MSTETTTLELRFGALSPPLREQLTGFKVPAKTVRDWQQKADAIALLAVHGILTMGEAGRARGRLFEKIRRGVQGVHA